MRDILVVLDDPQARRSLSELLRGMDCDVTEAGSLLEARHLLRGARFDLSITELELRDGNGIELCRMSGGRPEGVVVLVDRGAEEEDTGLPEGVRRLSRAVEAGELASLIRGEVASDARASTRKVRVVAPGAPRGGEPRRESGPGRQRQEVASASSRDEQRPEAASPVLPPPLPSVAGEPVVSGASPSDAGELPAPPVLLGDSPAMRKLSEQIRRMAPTRAGVLITGETGAGKELVAQALHDLSGRRADRFVAVNCGAISPSLVESELFGHEKGSFTGATRMHRGAFERADGGTLFLDEITEMPMDIQVRLLRVLELGEFGRVGGEEELSVDVRVLAATNRNPREAVAEGRLREDLFYRLNVLHIAVPSLRERREDILPLAIHFLDEIGAQEDGPKALLDDAAAVLEGYSWPGNVRQLRNVVQSAYLLTPERVISARALPEELTCLQPASASHSLTLGPGTTVREAERRLILATLERLDGHKTRTADMLGVSLKTLYNRLHTYGYPLGSDEVPGDDEPSLGAMA